MCPWGLVQCEWITRAPRPPCVLRENTGGQRRAAGAIFLPNHFKTGGFPCILATQATAQPPLYPISWTDPTDPARRPSVRPAHRPSGPLPWAPLGLGLTALRGSAPPGPLCFLVFVFSRPPAASDPPGRALNGESKTLRPAWATPAAPVEERAPRGDPPARQLVAGRGAAPQPIPEGGTF